MTETVSLTDVKYLYHLTTNENLDRILYEMKLKPSPGVVGRDAVYFADSVEQCEYLASPSQGIIVGYNVWRGIYGTYGKLLEKAGAVFIDKKNEFPVLVIPRVWLTGAVIKERVPVPRPNTFQYLHFGEIILPEIPEIITSTFEYKVLEKGSFPGLLNKLG